jgi:hypothetical protein
MSQMKCKSCGEVHYAKLAEPPQCVHPERCSCNYGPGFERCRFMEFRPGTSGDFIDDSKAGRWLCMANRKQS